LVHVEKSVLTLVLSCTMQNAIIIHSTFTSLEKIPFFL